MLQNSNCKRLQYPIERWFLQRIGFGSRIRHFMASPPLSPCEDSFGFGARNVNLAVSVVLGLLFCSMSPLVTLSLDILILPPETGWKYKIIQGESRWLNRLNFLEHLGALLDSRKEDGRGDGNPNESNPLFPSRWTDCWNVKVVKSFRFIHSWHTVAWRCLKHHLQRSIFAIDP